MATARSANEDVTFNTYIDIRERDSDGKDITITIASLTLNVHKNSLKNSLIFTPIKEDLVSSYASTIKSIVDSYKSTWKNELSKMGYQLILF